jgi:hypothetical protein
VRTFLGFVSAALLMSCSRHHPESLLSKVRRVPSAAVRGCYVTYTDPTTLGDTTRANRYTPTWLIIDSTTTRDPVRLVGNTSAPVPRLEGTQPTSDSIVLALASQVLGSTVARLGLSGSDLAGQAISRSDVTGDDRVYFVRWQRVSCAEVGRAVAG